MDVSSSDRDRSGTFGALALVQPLLVSGLLFALLLRHLGSWSITWQEVGWAGLLSGCLIGFPVLSGAVTGSQSANADRSAAVIAASVAVLIPAGVAWGNATGPFASNANNAGAGYGRAEEAARKMGSVTKPGGGAEQGRRVGVGVRVSTRRTWGSGLVGDPGLRAAGVVIEDHGDVVAGAGGFGRDWALPRRWAIALDDGSLVFRNDDELEVD